MLFRSVFNLDICCIDAAQHFGILHENGIVSEWRLKGKEFHFEKSNKVPYIGSLLCCGSNFLVASSDGRVCQVGGYGIYNTQDSIPVQQVISDGSNGYWISKQLIVARCHEQTIVEQALIPTAFPPLSLFLNGSKLGCVTRNARIFFYENGDWSERVLKGNAVSGEWQCRGVHVSPSKCVLALALTPARTYCHLSNRTPFVIRILALDKPSSVKFEPDILLLMKMTAKKFDSVKDTRIKRFDDLFTCLQKGQHVGDWQHFDKHLQRERILAKSADGSVVRAHRRFLRKFFPKVLPNKVDPKEEDCLVCSNRILFLLFCQIFISVTSAHFMKVAVIRSLILDSRTVRRPPVGRMFERTPTLQMPKFTTFSPDSPFPMLPMSCYVRREYR